jgi:alpha-mannosidase
MATITSAFPLANAVETDLLERPLEQGVSPAYALWRASPTATHDQPTMRQNGWTCEFRPFEIRTFRVTLHSP